MDISSILLRSKYFRKIYGFTNYIREPIGAILGWMFRFSFSLVIKRDPGLTVVINRPGGFFADNTKYFFIYATESAQKGERVVFLTTDRSIRNMIQTAGGESVIYHSFRSFYLLSRAKKVVFDFWLIPFIYPLIKGAKLIQIWHGAPLKQIEMDWHRKCLGNRPDWWKKISWLYMRFIGRYPTYDMVVSTSQGFITAAFHSCFEARQFIVTGYPRNDVLFGWPATGSVAHRLTSINVDKEILEAVNSAKSLGKKICLYAPTYRTYRWKLDNPFASFLDLSRLSELALRHNILFIFKLHSFRHGRFQISRYPGLLEYSPLCDVYPLLPLCDLLITDYSSIFFDFLLMDRPVLFFAYDLDDYLTKDRPMYFDYNAITPGAKCRNHDELELEMVTIINNGCNDEYAEMRKQVRSFTHDHMDNKSHRRLLESI